MNGLVLLLIGIAVLLCGYIFYGRYLCKKWGVGETNEPTPAHTMEDGIDYVPAKAPVLMGHHFSSIAGAGPITGPISAAMFGWLPCLLWILVGGIFFGGVHDFGALFASVRHKGKSIGEIISANMSLRAKRLFIIFSYLTLILVVAAFASIVAGTFAAKYVDGQVDLAASATPASVAMVSLLFIVIAIAFGFMVYRRNAPMGVSTIAGVIAICLCMAIGMNWHPIYLSNTAWMWIVGLYIAIASVTPVWILLQPRDYLSSFLLYAMLAIAAIGVVIAHPNMVDSTGAGLVAIGDGMNAAGIKQPIFPVLFTTIACGAISGFHSLVSSGTTSKQLDKETDAKPIAYGGMLLECVLAVITLVAIAYARQTGHTAGATDIFAGGVAGMASQIAGGNQSLFNILYTLLVLTYSAFCLTSLDTATRLARFMFQEFWIDGTKGETPENVTGLKKVMANPYIATGITVVLGILLGLNGYAKIWALFGSANQLLAALGLLAVATWLGNVGKDNKMFLIPMAFMLCVTIASLLINSWQQFNVILAGGADWGPYVQVVLGLMLVILAVVLAIEGVTTIAKQKKAAKA
ncbi:MAG: carbon starvation protein A [Clostridiales bacterium]|nr:carbon starvation protein A [Clostridiales bacterium]